MPMHWLFILGKIQLVAHSSKVSFVEVFVKKIYYFSPLGYITSSFAVVSTLLNFVRMFVRAHDENCKQIELEKKRAQKEAKNEKMKLSASKKESQHLLQTTVKSVNIK